MKRKIIQDLLWPKLRNENLRRRAYILNILLAGSIILCFSITIDLFIDLIRFGNNGQSLSPFITLIFLGIFIGLYFLNRSGHSQAASLIFILIYAVPTFFSSYAWGIDLPQNLLFYALIITMSGVLVGSNFSLFMTLICAGYTILLGIFELQSKLPKDMSWKDRSLEVDDIVTFAITFFIIALVSWLYSQEIEKSLRKAERSERELKKERDSLEIKVEERTQELKKAQHEKMTQLAQFAQFGRLASGIFHDLVSPLTALSLNLEEMKNQQPQKMTGIQPYLDQALHSSKVMENFLKAIRKQVQRHEIKTIFSPAKEIRQAIQVIDFKARKEKIILQLDLDDSLKLYGNPIKFYQIITNLVSNALDAYQGSNSIQKVVRIQLAVNNSNIILTVQDTGMGIPKSNLERIFNPLFTTKEPEQGMGLGLSIVKETIEADFCGTISVESALGGGAKFNIILPQRLEEYYSNGSQIKTID